MSKAELARTAGISPLTLNRIERGSGCRMDTKRKIILALGLKLSEKNNVFTDDYFWRNFSMFLKKSKGYWA